MPVMHSLYRESGHVTIDEAACRRCGQCAAICPSDVLEMVDGQARVSDDSPFGCVACGHCMMVCPEGSVTVRGRGISHDDLVPLPASAECANADALAALMRSRRSIRHFTEEDLDSALIDRIVDMASSAPMGIPPWDVGVVTVLGREKVQELASEIVKGYEGFLKMFRPWVLTLARPFMKRATHDFFKDFLRPLAQVYVESHREGRDKLFYYAPAVMIFHHSPYADAVDAAIACTYAMLAAESLGLGTTIIGGAPPILQRNKKLCRKLGIPEGNVPALAMILGHPSVRFQRTIQRHFTHVRVVS